MRRLKLGIALAILLIGLFTVVCTAKNNAPQTPAAKGANPAQDAANAQPAKPPLTNADVTRASQGFVELAKNSVPAVVYIEVEKRITASSRGQMPFSRQNPHDPFFDFFERFGVPEKDRVQKGQGSGFIISSDGFIITNNHVVGEADKIKVKLNDKRSFDAAVVGADPKTDIALIKIKDPSALPVLPLGDSDALEVGEWVVAIGNPFGLSHTVTAGIVSAKGRQIGMGNYDDFIQTDASINPGNSGGPLLNIRGEVIGINTLINASGQGIGFAIPINMAKGIVKQLQTDGFVTRGWLGVLIQEVTPEIAKSMNLPAGAKGALVADVVEKSPAAAAGIKPGDIIVTYNGKPISVHDDLPMIVAGTKVGTQADVEILREGKRRTLKVSIDKMPEEKVEKAKPDAKGELGLVLHELPPEMAKALGLKPGEGVLIVDVESGSSADDAGLRKGDVVLETNMQPVAGIQAFRQTLQKMKKGDTILLRIKREDGSAYVTLSK